MSKVNHRIKPIFEFKSLIYDYNILIYIKTILNSFTYEEAEKNVIHNNITDEGDDQ